MMFKTHVLIIKIPLSSKGKLSHITMMPCTQDLCPFPSSGAEVWGPFAPL